MASRQILLSMQIHPDTTDRKTKIDIRTFRRISIQVVKASLLAMTLLTHLLWLVKVEATEAENDPWILLCLKARKAMEEWCPSLTTLTTITRVRRTMLEVASTNRTVTIDLVNSTKPTCLARLRIWGARICDSIQSTIITHMTGMGLCLLVMQLGEYRQGMQSQPVSRQVSTRKVNGQATTSISLSTSNRMKCMDGSLDAIITDHLISN